MLVLVIIRLQYKNTYQNIRSQNNINHHTTYVMTEILLLRCGDQQLSLTYAVLIKRWRTEMTQLAVVK